MSDSELHALIDGDATAKSMAIAGNDSGCAARCMAIADLVHVPTVLTERGVVELLGPAVAEPILQKLAFYANANPPQDYSPTVTRFLDWLKPSNGGADWGHATVIAMAEMMTPSLLDTDDLAAIKSLSLRPPTITASDIARAWRGAV